MKKFNLCTAFALCGFFTLSNPDQSFCQTDDDFFSDSRTRNSRIDVSIGFGQNCNLNTFQWAKFKELGPKNNFHMGGGLRLNNLNYRGLLMVAEGSNKSGFTQFTSSGHVFGVNLMFATEYLYQGKFGLGGNFDLCGIAMGPTSPTYIPSSEVTPGELGGQISSISIREGLDKGRGTLNSEIYGLYKFGKRGWIKAGYSRVYTDITLNQTVDWFAARTNVFFVGLRLSY